VHNLADFHTMYNAIPNHRRHVPVPRQAIRLIAGGCRATVIATMLGHLLRCLYYRDRRCISGGWCKASWIADVFRVDLRNVKAARKHLVSIGWIEILDTPPALCNRLGALYPHPPLLDPRCHGAGSAERRPYTRKRITTSSGVLHNRITTPQ